MKDFDFEVKWSVLFLTPLIPLVLNSNRFNLNIIMHTSESYGVNCKLLIRKNRSK